MFITVTNFIFRIGIAGFFPASEIMNFEILNLAEALFENACEI